MFTAFRKLLEGAGIGIGLPLALLMAFTFSARACTVDLVPDETPAELSAETDQDARRGAAHRHADAPGAHHHDHDAHQSSAHHSVAEGSDSVDASPHCGEEVCDDMQCCVGAIVELRPSAGEAGAAVKQTILSAKATLASRDLPPDEHPPRPL